MGIKTSFCLIYLILIQYNRNVSLLHKCTIQKPLILFSTTTYFSLVVNPLSSFFNQERHFVPITLYMEVETGILSRSPMQTTQFLTVKCQGKRAQYLFESSYPSYRVCYVHVQKLKQINCNVRIICRKF